jgi:hypothetical protein
MEKYCDFLKSMIVLCISVYLVFAPIMNFGTLLAQEVDCGKILTQAEEKYTDGRFDETIALLTVCLDDPNTTPDQKQQAYRLMGLTYIAKDYLSEAKTAIEKLLKIVPNYQPDPIYDPPPFINLVEEVQAETIATKAVAGEEVEDNRMWYYIGGGALAATILTVVLLSGGDDDKEKEEPLPGPPNMP